MLANGQRVALDVTRATNSRERATVDALTKHASRVRDLEASWYLSIDHEDTSGSRLYDRAPILLDALAREGVERIDVRRPPSDEALRAVVDALVKLGVGGGCCLPDLDPPQILTGGHSLGATAPNVVNSAVEREASANLAKLERADADERHLWVVGQFDSRRHP